MTKQQLEGIFTFPNGIDRLYLPRQGAVENALFQLYEAAGLDVPKVYSFKSPLALQTAINHLMNPNRSAIFDRDFMREYPAYGNALTNGRISVRNRNNFFWDFVSKSVAAKSSELLLDHQETLKNMSKFKHISNSLQKEVENDVQKRLAIRGMKYYEVAQHPNFCDISWLLNNQKNIDGLSDIDRGLFLIYHDMIRNGIMHAWMLDGAVLWCPLPTTIELNDLKQFHREDGPSISWNDDYSLYFWKGVKVRKRIIEFPESITRLDALEESDPEIRKCIQERMGAKRFASLFSLIEVDRDCDLYGEEQFLWRTVHVDDLTSNHLYFAEVICPESKSRKFVEVPATTTNVWEAIALTFNKEAVSASKKVEA